MRKLLVMAAMGTAVALSSIAPRVQAAEPLIDWAVMFQYEDNWVNGVSTAGSIMSSYAVVNDFGGPLAGLPMAGREYTVVFLGLISNGTTINCAGPLCTYHTPYVSGFFQLWEDLGPVTAGDPCIPSTFNDGNILLSGTFSGFFMNANNFSTVGNFEGDLTFNAGLLYPLVADPGTALVTGGTDRRASLFPDCGANSKLKQLMDGKIDLNPPLPVEESSWSKIKTLYR